MAVASQCQDCGKTCNGKQCRSCYIKSHRVPEATCLKCGKVFRRHRQYNYNKNKPKFCSRACRYKALADGECTTGRAKYCLPKLTRQLITWFDDWDSARKRCVQSNEAYDKSIRKCKTCKKDMLPRKTRKGWRVSKKYCSEDCFAKRLPTLKELQCTTCGKTIRRWTKCGHATCKLCKKQAQVKQRKVHRKRRQGSERFRSRCRKFGGYFNSKCKAENIYERDEYLCHVCGRQCVLDKEDWNRQDCATVDHHPVPLSKGGDHDWHNVRTCCRRCNTNKGNDWDGQKLISFAPVRATQ